MKEEILLSNLFKQMELNKHKHGTSFIVINSNGVCTPMSSTGIKEWSISQASLEEVFLAIVTEAEFDAK